MTNDEPYREVILWRECRPDEVDKQTGFQLTSRMVKLFSFLTVCSLNCTNLNIYMVLRELSIYTPAPHLVRVILLTYLHTCKYVREDAQSSSNIASVAA